MNRHSHEPLAVVIALVLVTSTAHATPLLAIDFGSSSSSSILYDINPATGQTSNPRSTGVSLLGALAFASDGTLYALPAGSNPNLYTINPVSGAATTVGSTGTPLVIEGGLAFSSAGTLYGLYYPTGSPPLGPRNLLTINRSTGAATVVGAMNGTDDPSTLTWDNGNLYTLDTRTNFGGNALLFTLNPNTGAVLTTTQTNLNLQNAPVIGMAVDPATGTFYVAAGNPDLLYTMHPATGFCTSLGTINPNDHTITGLAFLPEPAMFWILFAAVGPGFLLARRRHSEATR